MQIVMRQKGKKTRYPGVFQIGRNAFRISGKATDPRTGKTKQVERLLDGVSAREAAVKRTELIAEVQEGGIHNQTADRVRIEAFAKSWLERKCSTVSPSTAARYTATVEGHLVPAFGDFYCDALRSPDVQTWVNGKLAEGYKVRTVHALFSVLRTMMRDAMELYDLPRDPTNRISFPEPEHQEGCNALTPDELGAFLEAMRKKFPRNYALTATLAFTGLRFCHASALKWDDVDETNGVIHLRRSQVHGKVGAVSRKKRAPRRYPLVPELAAILRWHRKVMLKEQSPGLSSGWLFPSRAGGLRKNTSSLYKAWATCLAEAKIDQRFTVHGLRRTFNDLARRAGVDAITTRSLTGHVTERMQEHYSSVQFDEQKAAVTNVVKLVSLEKLDSGMDGGMDAAEMQSENGKRPGKIGV